MPSSGWTPLGRGSDGRFGLRRFRAKLTPTAFGTHRAFTHALPPSFGLRSVPSTSIGLFFPLRFSEEKNKRYRQKGKKHEIRRSQPQDQRSSQLPRAVAGGWTEFSAHAVSRSDGQVSQLQFRQHHADCEAESSDMLLYLAGVNGHAVL